MDKVKIERKDGIVYERKKREKKCDTYLNFRVSTELFNKYKELANERGIKRDALIKQILQDYIDKEENN